MNEEKELNKGRIKHQNVKYLLEVRTFKEYTKKASRANFRSSPQVFYIKGFLENVANFTGKHLCQSLFLTCNFIKEETLTQAFSCEFCKIFKNTVFTETPLDDCFWLL